MEVEKLDKKLVRIFMSIKKNFFYSSFLTLANYLFPLLTFPYVSRVLGAESIGKYSFVDNIIQILVIVSMLGIATVGVREVAQNKDSQERLNKAFTALLAFNALSTLIGLALLVVLCYVVPRFVGYHDLLVVGGLKLLSTFLLVDWLYRGLEDFKFITQRTLLVRTLFVLSVFLFIKEEDDYVLYYFLIVFSITVNAIVNLLYARKYIQLDFDFKEMKRIARPILVLGAYSILAWLYNSFSTSFLGFVSTDEQVGYYATATKLYAIFLSVMTAFTTVMLPRLSQLVSQNRWEEFQQRINQSLHIVLTVSVPLAVFAIFFASDIIHIIAGRGYEGAVVPMKIVMPILIIVSIEQILIIQILTPLKRDKEVMISTAWGAMLGVALNILLVPILLGKGAGICWLASELMVMSSAIYFIRYKTSIRLPFYLLKERLLPFGVAVGCSCVLHLAFAGINVWARLILSAFILALVIYAVEKFLIKNSIISEIDNLIMNTCRNLWKR